jgi:Rps23 Pro-64 3,4-dihydroxylase Tpa1-like proline 4-hydroxylase
MICDIYDNVLEQNDAEEIQEKMKSLMWGYDYNSVRGGINKHWHIFCGEELIEQEYSFLAPIWLTAKKKYDFEEKYKVKQFKRVYCNAHTHGIEPHLHRDDGDFTMIYYPRLDWKPEWMGGTAIWNEQENEIEKYVNYIGNRLFVFDASLPHQAMTVSRQCYELRTCVVFKTYRRDANSDRLDFYK